MRVVCYHMYQVFKPTILNSHSLWLMESQSKSTAKPQSLRQAPVHCDSISKLPVITSRCKSTCVQQNAGDGNTQGSPLGRFAWPCGFPSPAFNSLPAEINSEDIRYALFRDRAGLLCDLEDAAEFLAQCLHILSDLVIGDFSVDLGRGDPFMSQHLADRFQRYTLCERNRRSEGMPRHVDRRIERQSGMFSVL